MGVKYQLSVIAKGDTKDAQQALSKLEKRAGLVSTKVRGAAKHIAQGFALASAAAVAGAAVYLKAGAQSLVRIQRIGAQTDAVIASTGNAARVSRKHIDDLAGRLESLTGVEAETITQGQNMLLTFTNIRNGVGRSNKIFDQATNILTDMSVALGTDMSKQAVQLGKALNDPIKGVTALTKVGVTFSAAQKKSIKSLVDSGKTMEAQKVILRELSKEFGGSAKAFGKTTAGQVALAGHAWGTLQETLASKLMPTILKLAQAGIRGFTWLDAASQKGGKLRPAIDGISKGLSLMKTALVQSASAFMAGFVGPGANSSMTARGLAQAIGNAATRIGELAQRYLPMLGMQLGAATRVAVDHREALLKLAIGAGLMDKGIRAASVGLQAYGAAAQIATGIAGRYAARVAAAAAAGEAAAVSAKASSLALAAFGGPVGIAATAVVLGLTAVAVSWFKTRQAAAEARRSAMEASAAMRQWADGLASVRQQQDLLAGKKLEVRESAVAEERAQRTYNDTVKQYGRSSLEAREAGLQLIRARRQSREAIESEASSEKHVRNERVAGIAVAQRAAAELSKLAADRRALANAEKDLDDKAGGWKSLVIDPQVKASLKARVDALKKTVSEEQDVEGDNQAKLRALHKKGLVDYVRVGDQYVVAVRRNGATASASAVAAARAGRVAANAELAKTGRLTAAQRAQMIAGVAHGFAGIGSKISSAIGTVKLSFNAVLSAIGLGGLGDGLGDPGGQLKRWGLAKSMASPVMLANEGGLGITSGRRAGAITSTGNVSDHDSGHAADFGGSDAQKSWLARAANRLPGVKQVIYSPMGWARDGGGFTPIPKSAGTVLKDHYNHVHVAMHALGGRLRSGIKQMASVGGRLTQPTIIDVAGEAGDEQVVPLSQRYRKHGLRNLHEAAGALGATVIEHAKGKSGKKKKVKPKTIQDKFDTLQAILGRTGGLDLNLARAEGTTDTTDDVSALTALQANAQRQVAKIQAFIKTSGKKLKGQLKSDALAAKADALRAYQGFAQQLGDMKKASDEAVYTSADTAYQSKSGDLDLELAQAEGKGNGFDARVEQAGIVQRQADAALARYDELKKRLDSKGLSAASKDETKASMAEALRSFQSFTTQVGDLMPTLSERVLAAAATTKEAFSFKQSIADLKLAQAEALTPDDVTDDIAVYTDMAQQAHDQYDSLIAQLQQGGLTDAARAELSDSAAEALRSYSSFQDKIKEESADTQRALSENERRGLSLLGIKTDPGATSVTVQQYFTAEPNAFAASKGVQWALQGAV